eukprot:5266765-Amphidinium_carterae.1
MKSILSSPAVLGAWCVVEDVAEVAVELFFPTGGKYVVSSLALKSLLLNSVVVALRMLLDDPFDGKCVAWFSFRSWSTTRSCSTGRAPSSPNNMQTCGNFCLEKKTAPLEEVG